MNQKIKDKICVLKNRYADDGILILGVFGSYARGEETEKSDIDLLYSCTELAFKKYSGWEIFPVLEKVKTELSQELGHKVDLADYDALSEIGKKYILPEVVYV